MIFWAKRALDSGAKRIWLAADTSGSFPLDWTERIQKGADELSRKGKEVTLLFCDSRVLLQQPYAGAFPPLVGGGGTDFCPVFEAAEKEACPPELIVYFTDGMGPAPEACKTQTLWIIAEGGRKPCAGVGWSGEIAWGEFLSEAEAFDSATVLEGRRRLRA